MGSKSSSLFFIEDHGIAIPKSTAEFLNRKCTVSAGAWKFLNMEWPPCFGYRSVYTCRQDMLIVSAIAKQSVGNI